MQKQSKTKQIRLLNLALQQRQLAYHFLIHHKKEIEQQSDFGWLMTLGIPEVGMLMAITKGKEARQLESIEQSLRDEILLLKMSLIQLSNS